MRRVAIPLLFSLAAVLTVRPPYTGPAAQALGKRPARASKVAEPAAFATKDGKIKGWKVVIPGNRALATPAVVDGKVFVGGGFGSHEFYAFDARTGKQRWRVERDEKTTWATPFIWQNKLRTEIITCGKNKNRSYDLSGKLLWELGMGGGQCHATPVGDTELLYVGSSAGFGGMAFGGGGPGGGPDAIIELRIADRLQFDNRGSDVHDGVPGREVLCLRSCASFGTTSKVRTSRSMP